MPRAVAWACRHATMLHTFAPFLLALVLAPSVRAGLYGRSPYVVELHGEQCWDADRGARKCPVLMEFYASWCGHCQVFAPTYSKLAERLDHSEGMFPYIVAGVDCAKHSSFCDAHGIDSFPTLKDFPLDHGSRSKPIALKGHGEDDVWDYLVEASKKASRELNATVRKECVDARLRLQKMNKEDDVEVYRHIPKPDVVWLQDLRRALYQALVEDVLRVEPWTDSDLLQKLRSFTELAARAFPENTTRLRLTQSIVTLSGPGEHGYGIDSQRWREAMRWLEPEPGDYLGCRGSMPTRRGYTCGLWQVFHALLANEKHATPSGELGKGASPHSGLAAIHGWIEAFFGCAECRLHFLDMASKTAWDEVREDGEASLWLWRAHNVVNKRLEGAVNEDPKRPKTQFPPATLCPSCRRAGSDDAWDEANVLEFLRNFYSDSTMESSIVSLDNVDMGRIRRTRRIHWLLGAVVLVGCSGLAVLRFKKRRDPRNEEDLELQNLNFVPTPPRKHA